MADKHFTLSCDPKDSALLVIDIQERLGQAMPSKVLNRILDNTRLLSTAAGLLDIAVLHTEQYPRGLGTTYADIQQALPPNTQSFTKTAFSCAKAEGFSAALAKLAVRQLVLVGMEAHVCVAQSAFDLKSTGHEVFVVEDAICSRRLENYQNALDRLRQFEIAVVSAESVVFEWLADARHEHFKAIQTLLR